MTNEGGSPRVFVAVLAGGQSLRARHGDASLPKQFRELDGRMLCLVSLGELVQAPGVVQAVLVVPDAWRPTVSAALADSALPVPCALATAGVHRTGSAFNALRALAELPAERRPRDHDLVAIHDAARPFATRHLLTRVAQAAAQHGAAVPGVAVTDTVIEVAGDVAGGAVGASYLERERLVAVQTPQVFRWQPLHAAHAWAASAGVSFTDDGGLLATRGVAPVVVMGEVGNWKVTTEGDWQRVERGGE